MRHYAAALAPMVTALTSFAINLKLRPYTLGALDRAAARAGAPLQHADVGGHTTRVWPDKSCPPRSSTTPVFLVSRLTWHPASYDARHVLYRALNPDLSSTMASCDDRRVIHRASNPRLLTFTASSYVASNDYVLSALLTYPASRWFPVSMLYPALTAYVL